MKPTKKNILRTYIAGYRNYHDKYPAIMESLILKREPKNPYDRNAIAIYTEEGRKIGYVNQKFRTNTDPRFNMSFSLKLPISAIVVDIDAVHQTILIDIAFSPKVTKAIRKVKDAIKSKQMRLFKRH